MRIAICTDQYLPQLGGVADSIDALSRGLRARGHTVRIYAPTLPGAIPDTEVMRLPTKSFFNDTVLLVLPRGVVRDIQEFEPDVIHHESFGTVGLLSIYASWKLGIPLVGTSHGVLSDYLPYFGLDFAPMRWMVDRYAGWFYSHSSINTAPSAYTLEYLTRNGCRDLPKQVISNPIDTAIFRPLPDRAALKQKLSISGKAVVVFGRIAVEKHLDVALDAFVAMRNQTDAELVFIGGGPYLPELEKMIEERNLKSRVRFLGVLRGESLVEALNACDVLLITSESEAQSMTTIQAMACGIPVVAADAAALPEYVHDGENGYTAEPGNPESFADALLRILNDSGHAYVLGKQGSIDALQFSPDKIAEKVEGLYMDIVRN